MVKVLFCGDVDGNWNVLVTRLNELQKSDHGPFDALFLVGKFSGKASLDGSHVMDLPIKAYAFDKSFRGIDMHNLEVICEEDSGIKTVCNNLTVAYLTGDSTDFSHVRSITSSPGYRGCDILITSDWPREMHHFLDEAELKDFRQLNIGIGSGTKAASSMATLVKPRYHFVAGKGCFYQRSPYRNIAVESDTSNCFAFTRLISIDKVSASKDKTKKWLHALSFNPIVNLTDREVSDAPDGTTDCPYVTVGEKVNTKTTNNFSRNPVNKRQKTDKDSTATAETTTAGSGSFFFGSMGVPRDGSGGSGGANVSLNLEAPNNTISTLFIGGLPRELTDYELKSSIPGATAVKRPPGKAFAFVDFTSHAAAKKVVEGSARHGLVVRGRTLTVGWGKERQERTTGEQSSTSFAEVVYERQLVPPSSESRTLFVGGLPSNIEFETTEGDADANTASDLSPLEKALVALFPGAVAASQVVSKAYAFVEFDEYSSAMAAVTHSLQESVKLKGKTLTVGWAKGDVINSTLNKQQTREILSAAPSEDSKVLFIGHLSTSAVDGDIRSIFGSLQDRVVSIRRPEGKLYAFVEFVAPSDAQEAINVATAKEVVLCGSPVVVGWAKGRAADNSNQSADCWFCLASPVVKVHLVVSVGDHSYVALPRGGVTNMHVLISPIDCVPSRVHLSTEAKAELTRYQDCIDELHRKDGYTAMRFERALRTKGSRNHMQVHIVPFAAHLVQQGKALDTFMQCARNKQLKFHEIQDSSKSVDEVVVSMEGGPYQEYFYIEVPISASSPAGAVAKYRRFVYVSEESSGPQYFPMQFGIELAAEIMGQPEKAHWKNCVLSDEGEHALAEKFRDSFAPYDFTL